MDLLKIMCGIDYKINDNITLKNPTLGEIVEFGEENFLQLLYLFCTDGYDMMVQLDDIGVNYQDIDDYEVFLMLTRNTEQYIDSLNWFMGIKGFDIYKNNDNDMLCIYDTETGIMIDKGIYYEISKYLRVINFINKNRNRHNPGNETTRKSIIEQERKKLKRREKFNKKFKSALHNQISALIWSNSSGYNYSNIWNLTLYQFNEGLKRINKIKQFDSLMNGVYFGTVDLKQINQEEIDWLSDIH